MFSPSNILDMDSAGNQIAALLLQFLVCSLLRKYLQELIYLYFNIFYSISTMYVRFLTALSLMPNIYI